MVGGVNINYGMDACDMTSSIDPTKPVQGNPTTASQRQNWAAAKNEIEDLQARATTAEADIDALQAFQTSAEADILALEAKTQNLTTTGTIAFTSVTGTVPIAQGGTGATTAALARIALGITAGEVSLATTGTTTAVALPAVTANSRILLYPADAGAASMEGIGSYVSAKTAGVGFTITHAVYSGARTYSYEVIG